MSIRNELIEGLLCGQDPSSVMRQDGPLGELNKAPLNRLMPAGAARASTTRQSRSTRADNNF
ncbi:hypothetical protein [Rhodopila sp.]|uniref:hypothetical protein n=1 Tax=Rhodopila sp. TaxID=2480087 RepID=UPI003D130560